MINALNNYFQYFIRPTSSIQDERGRLSHYELLGLTWSLHFIYAFYSIFAVYLGVKSYQYLSQSQDFSHLLFEAMNVSFQKLSLFMAIVQAIVYPFVFQFTVKFWNFILKFYAEVFEVKKAEFTEEVIDQKINELISSLFSANLFLMIPIFGNVLSFLTQAYFLFIGTRSKLGFTRTQAFLVLLTPVFLIFILVILIASYFSLIFSLL